MSKAIGPTTPPTDRTLAADDENRFCGIVRPIADMGSYTAKHWREVHNVIAEAVEPLGFTLRLVSESDTAGVILTEIVSNLYLDEIVIVDVSGRNPNVMFELGMRLAFEKPAIIVMDDETPFSFDISPVKHIRYPKTLRYADIVRFKSDIAAAVTATLDAGPEKKNYLQQFGPIKVTELGSQSVEMNAVAQDVGEMKRLFMKFLNNSDFQSRDDAMIFHRHQRASFADDAVSQVDVDVPSQLKEKFIETILAYPAVTGTENLPNGVRIYIEARTLAEMAEIRNLARVLAREFRIEAK